MSSKHERELISTPKKIPHEVKADVKLDLPKGKETDKSTPTRQTPKKVSLALNLKKDELTVPLDHSDEFSVNAASPRAPVYDTKGILTSTSRNLFLSGLFCAPCLI